MHYLPLFAKAIDQNHTSVKLRTKHSLRFSQEKLTGALEPIVFHIICVLEALNQNKIPLQDHSEFFDHLMNRIKDSKTVDCTIIATEFNVPPNEILKKGIKCFQSVSDLLDKPYTIDDLKIWIKICQSKSISETLPFITPDTPSFILFDIISRNSPFREEYKIQSDLWVNNLLKFNKIRLKDNNILHSAFENVIYYAILHEPNDLKQLIKKTLEVFNLKDGTSVKSNLHSKLIWNIAYYASKYQRINYMEIANAHEVIVSNSKSKNYQLTMSGYLGIAFMMSDLSRAKAIKLVEVAERKFINTTTSKKDLVNYHLTKIWLANTPEEAAIIFSTAIARFAKSSKLWLIFIRKLKKSGVFTETRAMMFFRKLINSKVKLTTDLVKELLHPIENYYHMEEIYHLTKSDLNSQSINIFLPKYIEILQKHKHDDQLPQTFFPWDEFANLGCNSFEGFKGFKTIEKYLIKLYSTFSYKSIQFIASYMKGLTKSQDVFSFYEREILGKGHLPNALCLSVLLDSARKSKSPDKYTQFAILEFERHVRKDNVKTGIMPDDRLWFKYITLLAKFENISELSKIMKWWLDTNFDPQKVTLMQLLYVLPQEFTYRHIKHHEIAKSQKDWEWPTMEEYNTFKQKKIASVNRLV
ncbi:uncharacterized protein KGF55_004206 [Candida pseudojiufengensis]|uniref:uncharacterized protein n=1 Tax=Candida pseudojiufengensis TaxID=497109 RepID=UPI00222410D8|nr:uncharacterized protein KGF55_004206 [Candida pseudojiufengensis]KAI5960939.1 hypothetical protein KGF55_004206 [Candida pseudojiufengensis]